MEEKQLSEVLSRLKIDLNNVKEIQPWQIECAIQSAYDRGLFDGIEQGSSATGKLMRQIFNKDQV